MIKKFKCSHNADHTGQQNTKYRQPIFDSSEKRKNKIILEGQQLWCIFSFCCVWAHIFKKYPAASVKFRAAKVKKVKYAALTPNLNPDSYSIQNPIPSSNPTS